MCKTLSDLANMSGAYLVCIGSVILYFIILQPGSIFDNDLHYLVCKTFIGSQGAVVFNNLNLCLLIYKHQAAGLRKYIYRTCIRNMINIKRVFNVLPFSYMNEYGAVHESSIQGIDPVFQVQTAVSQPLCYQVVITIIGSFLQGDYIQAG